VGSGRPGRPLVSPSTISYQQLNCRLCTGVRGSVLQLERRGQRRGEWRGEWRGQWRGEWRGEWRGQWRGEWRGQWRGQRRGEWRGERRGQRRGEWRGRGQRRGRGYRRRGELLESGTQDVRLRVGRVRWGADWLNGHMRLRRGRGQRGISASPTISASPVSVGISAGTSASTPAGIFAGISASPAISQCQQRVGRGERGGQRRLRGRERVG